MHLRPLAGLMAGLALLSSSLQWHAAKTHCPANKGVHAPKSCGQPAAALSSCQCIANTTLSSRQGIACTAKLWAPRRHTCRMLPARLSRSGSAREGSTTMVLTAAAAPARKLTKLSMPAICRWAEGDCVWAWQSQMQQPRLWGCLSRQLGNVKSTSELKVVVVPKPASLLMPVLAGMQAVTICREGGFSATKGSPGAVTSRFCGDSSNGQECTADLPPETMCGRGLPNDNCRCRVLDVRVWV